jgi:hypothetical protein
MALARPNKIKERGDITPVEYIENPTDLTSLNLDELAERYQDIDQQAQLMKGLILLEARSRFPSNNEFGDWIQSVPSLCGDGNQIRNRYMNFARYFKGKDRTGISLTACYEISAPINEDVADKVYDYALNKNLSVSDIKAKIKFEKKLLISLSNTSEESAEINENIDDKPELMPREDISFFIQQVLLDIDPLPQHEAIRVLKSCLKQLNKALDTESQVD